MVSDVFNNSKKYATNVKSVYLSILKIINNFPTEKWFTTQTILKL